MYEQAYGAGIEYNNSAYPLPAGLGSIFSAELAGTALTALMRYKLDEGFSVHGGLRYVTMSGNVNFSTIGQKITFGESSDVGFLAGFTYEIPEIALRASLTYNSETEHNHRTTSTLGATPLGPYAAETGKYTLPQSVNLDFQTGIAEGTLLLASVRWAEWTKTAINTTTALGSITHSNDIFTYSLGAAYRLNDDLAVLGRVSFEKANGGLASDVAPTDGQLGLSLAAIYDIGDARVTGGVNYTSIGNATTRTGATFADNYALGFGLRVGFSF